MIYIVNCALPYIFKGIDDCTLINCNASMSYQRRLFNRLTGNQLVPEDIEQYKKLRDSQSVIFFADTKRFVSRCEHIEEVVPKDTRLHLYFWNPMSFYEDSIKDVKSRWHIWTFSKEESHMYNMRYAETFYNKHLVITDSIQSDLFFVGLDKGRRTQLNYIREEAERAGLICDINIVDSIRCLYNKRYSHSMPYDVVRNRIAQTRALIDITQEGQTGLTQRVMESLFYKKKLITNNYSIVHSPFYSPDNILIVGKDDISHLSEFIKSPYIDLGVDIYKYDVSSWISRILKVENFDEIKD